MVGLSRRFSNSSDGIGRVERNLSTVDWRNERYALTSTEISSGVHREVSRVLMASSAVNRPINSACFRLVVVWMGVRSSRYTNVGAWIPFRLNFTRNFVFFMVGWFYSTLVCG